MAFLEDGEEGREEGGSVSDRGKPETDKTILNRERRIVQLNDTVVR